MEDIGEAGLNLDVTEDAARSLGTFKNTGIISISPVNTHLEIEKSGTDIFVKGSIDADAGMRCARCLGEFSNHIHSDINLVFLKATGEISKEEEKELTREELDINYYTGEEIDVTEILMEQIILDLPVNPLCRLDCKGLCQKCGADLNTGQCNCPKEKHIDARLKKLKEFKLKDR